MSIALLILPAALFAQHEHHDHGEAKEPVKRPRVFLDKSPRIVHYQLKRLDNERLLLVERRTDDKKYAPVYQAILTRAGMSPQHREEALAALVTLNQRTVASELILAIQTLKGDDRQTRRTARQLGNMLLRLPAKQIQRQRYVTLSFTDPPNPSIIREIGYAAIIAGGEPDAAWAAAHGSFADWAASIALLPKPDQRSARRPRVLELLDPSRPAGVRRAAIAALASIPSDQKDTFVRAAEFVSDTSLRTSAVRTLLRVPAGDRDDKTAAEVVDLLVEHAETTPAAERTTDEFIDAMQLVDQLLALVPVDRAKTYRERLREVTVRVVRIHTVEEEMRYDIPYFAVEAGRPVQVVLKNEDLMPHNLVITKNGALKEVADLGLALGPNPGFEGKPYVPKSGTVLFATGMVQSLQQERLTFTAPSEPGEYPYVCTFPRHWMRMYGVMVVVPDLDAWLQNPVTPKDPIGSNRAFVNSWKVDDFVDGLETSLRGRSPEIGERLFKEATCLQCHRTRGQGGQVGPELTDVFKRWKGDPILVLREILEPSHRIDPKYAVHIVILDSGRTVTGIVQAEDAKSVSILDNPEAKEPTVVQKSDIDEMVRTSKSMMPKALLDRFSKDEILEILAFLRGLAPAGQAN